ncbi:hypothetical protein HME9304_00032 [Flagellimonas maritima]|uniref:Fibronectin type-III domain-containing protein n=1 Tax=Flagellimonas maritima TaxID=1383885 RepID=A0A2Z4LML1_9FLAO|nr:fibronectin type III domain-containing protein [Allomuricauda aurantiaca]AWX43045.1 hypothetical protein HME9304_00032 [Allomuricauda aurantiaca]
MENRGISLKTQLSILLMAIFVLLTMETLSAQSFPVNIAVRNVGASPTQLSSYADAAQANGPLLAILALNDLNITGREVQLRMSFEGGGIDFQSVPNPIGAGPFFLDGGIPLALGAPELAPYFEIANVTGISPTVYGRPLPEGSYQICLEAFDVLTGKRLSARSCTNVFLFQNRPPFLVLPANGAQVDETNPQNIVFQWTPRQLNITNVEYELSLVEIWDGTIDPQAAFLSAPPLFQATTTATSYLYGPADPILLPDRAYAWRVRAKAVDGAEGVGPFENQGHSEIFSFVHISPCEVPPNLRHEVRGSAQANILWDDPTTTVPEFTVRYRQKGAGNAWFINRTTANWTTLWDLRAGTPYEYQLKKDCGLGESGWSTVRELTTAMETETEDLYRCGISPNIDVQNQEPLSNLSPGEQFVAGDFTVTTTQVNGGEGYYSGKGHVRIPYLGNVKLAVHFDNILLNTDRQLLQGTVVTEYDPTMGNILDTGDVVETVGELGGAIGDLFEALSDELDQIVATIKDDRELNRQVDAAIEILQINLDDPNNGLTDEQEENIRNFISDRGKVEEAIIAEKEKIANGERDEVIKQNLVSNFSEEDHLTRCTLEKLLDINTMSRDKIFDITSNGEVFNIVKDNFENWLDESQNVTTSNIEINAIQDWSVRADAQFSKKRGRILFDRLFETIRKAPKKEVYNLHPGLQQKGIYLGTYEMKGKTHGLALYTPKTIPQVFKLESEDYCELVSSEEYNNHIKVIEVANSLVLAFLNENQEVTFMVQLMDNNDEDFESILKWFGVLKLYKPNILVRNLTQQQILDELYGHEELMAVDIGAYRAMIANLPEDERAEAYLELQRHVPYYSQLDNMSNKHRSCNITSLAMNLNFMGKGADNMRLPDNLLLKAEKKEITKVKTWRKLAADYDIKSNKKEDFIELYDGNDKTETELKDYLTNLMLPVLEMGSSISLSLFPNCKGHIVRVQEVTLTGLVIDDPYGNCPLECITMRESCEDDSYKEKGDRNNSSNYYGNDVSYTWEVLTQITLKYMVVFNE